MKQSLQQMQKEFHDHSKMQDNSKMLPATTSPPTNETTEQCNGPKPLQSSTNPLNINSPSAKSYVETDI